MKYAAIGPHVEPPDGQRLQLITYMLAIRGLTLCSTRYSKIDVEFEQGARSGAGERFIRIPTLWDKAMAHAKLWITDPAAWKEWGEDERGLRAAQSTIMFGDRFSEPVSFVLTYGYSDLIAHPVNMARAFNIPVFDLSAPDGEASLWVWLAK